jgi:hypothetical protein
MSLIDRIIKARAEIKLGKEKNSKTLSKNTSATILVKTWISSIKERWILSKRKA